MNLKCTGFPEVGVTPEVVTGNMSFLENGLFNEINNLEEKKSVTTASIKLRYYQQEALDALLGSLAKGEHPVCALATGGGKSLLIAALCAALPGRVLVATHRQELLTQNSATLRRLLPDADYGIYSAGLGERTADTRVVFGGIQSIYQRMEHMQDAGEFGTVIADEAHRCPPRNAPSMYRTIFEACHDAQRVGMTATPYRLAGGLLHVGPDAWFTCMPVQIGMRQLTDAGYLAPLVGVRTAQDVDTSLVHVRSGEFALGELSQAACEEAVVHGAVEELCALAAPRRAWLVFCVDVAHTELVTAALRQAGIAAQMLLGTTPQEERQAVLAAFRAGKIRALVNCEVATTGFDLPLVDCVAMLRPTMSRGLAVQMIGRGTRLAPGKRDALILDLAGNLARHVPLDGLPEVRKSPALQAKEAAATAAQAAKVRAEQERQAKHGIHATDLDPMALAAPTGRRTLAVLHCTYMPVAAKKYPGRKNLLVRYVCRDGGGGRTTILQWLCVEYGGWVREQCRPWFTRRGAAIPQTAAQACAQAIRYPLPRQIVVERQGTWDRVVMEYFAETDAQEEGT